MFAETVVFLAFGLPIVAVMGCAAVSLFYFTGTDFLRFARIAFRAAIMASSGLLATYWLSLVWWNPPNFPFLVTIGEYATSPKLLWVSVFLAFPVIESAILAKALGKRWVELGLDFGLAVAHFASAVVMLIFWHVVAPLFHE